METNNPPRDRDRSRHHVIVGIHASSPIVPGLILLSVGVLFLLDNFHILHVSNWWQYWPVILIAVGLVQLVDSSHSGGRIGGAVMLAVGALFLAENTGYLGFEVWQLWPLILIAVGLLMLWNRMGIFGADNPAIDRARERITDWASRGGESYTGGFIHEAIIFGGGKRVVTSQNFEGGHVSTIFGGLDIDLTRASMEGNSAKMSVSAIYGGVVIRVPATWNVEARGAGIFGGFGDHTVHPPLTPETKRLLVRGAGIFGGVTIRN